MSELQRIIEKVGVDLWRDDPIVHNALRTIAFGRSTEDALVLAVQALAARGSALEVLATRALQSAPLPTHVYI